LNGIYHGSGTLEVGNVATDGSAIAGATTGDVFSSNNYAFNGTVTGNQSSARSGAGNVFSAQILSGSSYAGYSLSSSVLVGGVSQHPNTGGVPGQTTTASLLYGTEGGAAGTSATVSMSFDSAPAPGDGPDNSFRTSDILTLTGIRPKGSTGPGGDILTDEYVLQLTYDTSAAGIEYIAQNTGAGWVAAVTLNSTQTGDQLLNESYSAYLSSNGGVPTLGAYGYSGGVAWAVLDHDATGTGISEFAVIPEPGTYAMIFSGFGMLIAFRRLRRRSRLIS
jgi:hypothetical protein